MSLQKCSRIRSKALEQSCIAHGFVGLFAGTVRLNSVAATTSLVSESAVRGRLFDMKYSTLFTFKMSGQIGLSFVEARRILHHAIQTKIKEKEATTSAIWIPDICSISLIACIALGSVHHSTVWTFAKAMEMSLLVIVCVINIVQNKVTLNQSLEEVVQKLKSATTTLLSSTSAQPNAFTQSHPTLFPSVCYTACYRDLQWQRIPTNLLAKGDVIALTNGDTAPGDVQMLDHDINTKRNARSFKRECQILVQEKRNDTVRCNATFKPELLLSLCGDMRIFIMEETPIEKDIDRLFLQINNRPRTLTQKADQKARHAMMRICCACTIIISAAISIRHFTFRQSLKTTLDHLLIGAVALWFCFASLNMSLNRFLIETTATASMLPAIEKVLFAENSNFVAESCSEKDDTYDVEDRERVRMEKVTKKLSFGRSLKYFYHTLSHRATAGRKMLHRKSESLVQIPLSTFRLFERLGSTTMLCCFDDDILCQETPSAEELYLLNDKPSGSTVLDLHFDQDSETGLRFENPKWRSHVSSLKPLGLAILLNDMDQPKKEWDHISSYLANYSGMPNPNSLDKCYQHLSAHVRMLPFPKHLVSLSREIGFIDQDTGHFEKSLALHIISPRLAYHEHTIDHHDQGQEDTRYRGNIKSHIYSTVVLDRRCNRHQLLSRGHPAVAVGRCTELWDGKSICPLTREKRQAILEMYHQWRVEDLDCVALTYAPVSQKLNPVFREYLTSNDHSDGKYQMLPAVYLVEDTLAGDVGSGNSLKLDTKTEEVATSPEHSLASELKNQWNFRPGSTGSRQPSTGSELKPHQEQQAKLLWDIQEDQIFLGMIASGVQPKACIPDFVEDLTASGIRFVYFSPRNMRRSKLLAEKMGIETDWNCAISLRSLDSDGPDPHRMTSNYSDWDVKARLPHGVKAIKKHLKEVDNVPLLVSLYTDSTSETIDEMISVFQENNEVVLGIGSSLRESNASLFSRSDIAIAIQAQLRTIFDEPLPDENQAASLSTKDIELSRVLNTLTCSFRIPNSHEQKEHSGKSLAQIIELIRLGRCVLTNYHQTLTFLYVSQLQLLFQIVMAYLSPFPILPQPSFASLMFLLWLIVPLLSLSMLASPGEKNTMKLTPRKNDIQEFQSDLARLSAYFLIRHVPTMFFSVLVYECLLGFSLAFSHAELPTHLKQRSWIEYIFLNQIAGLHPRPACVIAAVNRAEAGMTLFIGLSLITSSCGYLYRCQSFCAEPPLRNFVWAGSAAFLLGLHILFALYNANTFSLDGNSLGLILPQAVPWYFWLTYLLWPILQVSTDAVRHSTWNVESKVKCQVKLISFQSECLGLGTTDVGDSEGFLGTWIDRLTFRMDELDKKNELIDRVLWGNLNFILLRICGTIMYIWYLLIITNQAGDQR
uniref:Uncharacterized protein AlNc14C15G1707 n=1 Tax=Albugo laibachii Nc14 TaxID=890382 RepID=F0W419_9STRA|nr:conserved hypothetical protein [Albugo laibachii Nc14]|eukprot:CCA15816.1 conserved hypothetical protein [Albugo laibachii Nc14]